MSTLVPGSEPWQIAEPLEYAADIWKALEEKYGPNSARKGFDANDVVHDEGDGQATDGAWQEKVAVAAEQPAAPKESLQEVAEMGTHERGRDQAQAQAVTRCAAEDAQSLEEKRKWNNDSMRDQRFLWALLNAGKEEELTRTNEMKKS